MKNIPDEYDLSEEDIDKVINWLRINDSKNATPEQAIDFLIKTRLSIHKYAHENPEKIEELYKKFKSEKEDN